jgi:manganese/zinc/iron transport system substrate-binding protein
MFFSKLLSYKMLFALVGLATLSLSCTHTEVDDTQPNIVCTTGMLGDAVKQLMKNDAEVHVLMGPGVDPHLYKASQGDVVTLSKADLIVYNGLHLEGKMGEIFDKLSSTKNVIAAAEVLPESALISAEGFNNAHDPHVWFDVSLWTRVVGGLSAKLQALYPNIKDSIQARETTYLRALQNLHTQCLERIREIPEGQRVLITAHDAFKYFGRAYGIEVRGLQGISTTAEYGLQDISTLVSFITEQKIKAIFVESSVSPKSIQAVIEGCKARGHDVVLGGELFSDALGKAGTPEGQYIGMVRHNVETISNALK